MKLSVIIPTCPPRTEKLRRLLAGIAETRGDRRQFEVVLVVDAADDGPLRLAHATLPHSLELRGLTQPRQGPARARNVAIRAARGDWLLFLDDDMIIDGQVIPAHLDRIRQAPSAKLAYLGCTEAPRAGRTSLWLHLLARSPMVFFGSDLRPDGRYGFRYFWTCHLSVRADLVREVGGFDERFPNAMHEDIELGWRLEQRIGVQVAPLLDPPAWHDHPLSPREYFLREHRSGRSAAVAREINPAFFQAVWARFANPHQTLGMLRDLFTHASRQFLRLLGAWAAPSARCPSDDELQAAYFAHLPLKRMMFCQGMLGRPFEELWEEMQ
jgi:glycosyltransferase involved in cell wall biosynthesis